MSGDPRMRDRPGDDVTTDLDGEALARATELIRSRRSVRSFEPGRRVSSEILAGIAEAGRWAPSGANTQPWELCIVHEPDAIASTAAVLAAQADRLNRFCKGFPHVHKKHWVHDAVAIIAVFVDTRWADAYPTATDPAVDAADYATNRENILLVSVGAAVQNLQLATAAVGLTSAWLSGGGEPTTAAELQRLLGFPATHVPYGVVPIGWPHRRSESRWRRPLDEVIHWNEADDTNLRSAADIERYIAEERRDSIYRDAETRERLLSASAEETSGVSSPGDDEDPIDDGR